MGLFYGVLLQKYLGIPRCTSIERHESDNLFNVLSFIRFTKLGFEVEVLAVRTGNKYAIDKVNMYVML